eukprot:TRINITY_DN6049_c0_g1_i3.p1 TRINITY_DN6049_c0_g1~~TRINITY_DN6049_c0_g1_i3.p1  ORF type:complete len:159 (-),score=39.61 TRINITY_DN6049_c0_g1_i3:42-518(-)
MSVKDSQEPSFMDSMNVTTKEMEKLHDWQQTPTPTAVSVQEEGQTGERSSTASDEVQTTTSNNASVVHSSTVKDSASTLQDDTSTESRRRPRSRQIEDALQEIAEGRGSARQKRYKAYRAAASVFNYTEREQLPDEIVQRIRERFPEATKQYVGFKQQ